MNYCPTCGGEFPDSERVCPADGAVLSLGTKIDPLIGKTFGGKYRVVGKLGGGGMGVVYRAEHTLLDHAVALKVLRAHLSDDSEYLQRFQREARVACKLKHPCAVTLHDFGIEESFPYLAMEYLEGEPLSEIIKRESPIAPERTFRIVEQVSEVIQEAHDLGIVHRDLKPENIFITHRKDGSEWPKVLDFGVAKVLASEKNQSVVTQVGTIFGSPRYMAPEQAQGGDIDGRVDLYSIGVLLYEMLSGKPPFEGNSTMETLVKIVSMDPVPVKIAAAPTPVSDVQNEIVMRLLRRNRDERYANAGEFLEDFRKRFLPRPVVKNRSTATRVLVFVLAGVIVSLGAVVMKQPSSDDANRLTRELKELEAAKLRHQQEADRASDVAEKKKAEAEAALREAETQRRLAAEALEQVNALSAERLAEQEKTEKLRKESELVASSLAEQQERALKAADEAERFRELREKEAQRAAELRKEAEDAAARAQDITRRASEEADAEKARREAESSKAESLKLEAAAAQERANALRTEMERAQKLKEQAESDLRATEERKRKNQEVSTVPRDSSGKGSSEGRSKAELEKVAAAAREAENRRQSAIAAAKLAEERREKALRDAAEAEALRQRAESEALAAKAKEAEEAQQIQERRIMPRQGKRR